MSIKIDTSAFRGLQSRLKEFSEKIKTEVAFNGAAAMSKVIYDEAKTNVPVQTGKLKEAIYRVYSPEKSSNTLKLYRISWNKKKAPHGHLIEFGTSRAPAHPFIRPAASRVGDAIKAGQVSMAAKIKELKVK